MTRQRYDAVIANGLLACCALATVASDGFRVPVLLRLRSRTVTAPAVSVRDLWKIFGAKADRLVAHPLRGCRAPSCWRRPDASRR
jgi:hypothetical protein